jgi:hypothetical protein
MPGPGPPPTLACKSDDPQAGVPEKAGLDAAAAELAVEPGAEAAGDVAATVGAAALAELARVPAGAAGAAADELDDAAQPAASRLAAISGTDSSAFFMGVSRSGLTIFQRLL